MTSHSMPSTTRLGDRLAVPRTSAGIGVAVRDITPPVGIRAKNWGPADWARAEGAHHEMTLTALAIVPAADPGAGPTEAVAGRVRVMITADGTWWRRVADEWGVRGRVLAALGLEADQLTLSLSHTHAGPVLCAADEHLDGGELIPGYLESLGDAAIAAAKQALATAAPGRIEWARGRSALAVNRELDVDGRALVGYNPQAEPADDTVLVGRITSRAGETLGTIVNYACHPTTLSWQNRLVSPDYVGAMRQLVSAATGAPVLFLQGASGELSPRQQYTGDLDVADRHGRSLGHAVLAALDSLPAPGTELELAGVVESGAPLAMWEPAQAAGGEAIAGCCDAVDLELVDLPTLAELEAGWADIDPRSREERLGRARNLRDGYIDGPTVRHPVWAWRLGDAVVVAHPGEAYSRLQTTLRARFPGTPIVVANLTNGPGFVYLPTQEAYDRGAYQAWQTPLRAGSLDRLEAHAIRLVAELLDPAQ
ncbi:hypothetical protein ACFSWE_14215 [Leucobacter albus]|uniref:Neutral/alkaline ceramidase-like enzyme n=1 Tax=Leucobacter albus TaxID=272210 RepID=A0ABW3TLN9_9MICO